MATATIGLKLQTSKLQNFKETPNFKIQKGGALVNGFEA
jgi:hypothetical protein